MEKLFGKISFRRNRVIYTLCFFLFCLIDQRIITASGLDGVKEFFTNLTGVVMAVLILCQYKKEDIAKLKVPYLIWSIVGACAGIGVCIWAYFNQCFWGGWIVLVLGCFLFGYILLYTLLIVVKEKRWPKVYKSGLLMWAVMMILMMASRSDYMWPFAYFVMFGCLMLTPFSEEGREDLFQGLLNGVILSLFVYQAFCCVFRPYDVVRYTGIYANSNNAALYYLQVLVAVMLKYLDAVKRGAGRLVKVFYWLGLGVTLSFLFMTIGRTGWLVAALLCFVFLLVLRTVQQKKRFILNGLALVLCAVVMFPCTFGIVRYTPPLFHHPIWLWGEWSEEKVHSWDAWDSEKYIDMDELLEGALGRVTDTVSDFLQSSNLVLRAQAADSKYWNEAERKTPVITVEQGQDSFLLRKTIYEKYYDDLTLWGRKQSEQGFQMHEGYWIGHAHNIYLQYGVDFGVFVLALFLALSVWACVVLLGKFTDTKKLQHIGYFLFLLVPLSFGVLEYCWGVSAFATLTLFLGWTNAIREDV